MLVGHMARRSLLLSNECVYHVVNRSNNREWFYVPIEEAWGIFCEILRRASGLYGTEIHTFVLMSNHYHMMVSTRRENLHRFMRYFQTEVCREIQRRAERINHVFGTRYKWSTMWTSDVYAIAYKYVMRNPVKAGLSQRVEEYRYSSMAEWVVSAHQLPIVERIDGLAEQLPRLHQERLVWLNQPTTKESDELVRKAMRRTLFQFSRGNEVRREVERLSVTYNVALKPETQNAPATFSAE